MTKKEQEMTKKEQEMTKKENEENKGFSKIIAQKFAYVKNNSYFCSDFGKKAEKGTQHRLSSGTKNERKPPSISLSGKKKKEYCKYKTDTK